MDYSKFDNIVDDEETREKAAREEDAKRALEEVKAARKAKGLKTDEDGSDSDESESDLSPLFWTKPPSARKNASKQALKMEELLTSMAYMDRSPDAIAEDSKERGNIAFKQGNPKDALILYTEALEWAHKGWTAEKDMSEFIGTVLANRAAVELKLKNYRSTIKEAQASLRVSPSGPASMKARLRGAKACLELNKPKEAFSKFLNNLPSLQADSSLMVAPPGEDDDAAKEKMKKSIAEAKELAGLVKMAEAMLEKLVTEEKEKRKILIDDQKEDHLWRDRFAKHGVQLGPLAMDVRAMAGARLGDPILYPTIDEQTGVWHWPCIFMYPEFAQSDFVQAFSEDASFNDILATMFPPGIEEFAPWDLKHHYEVPELEIYFRERAAAPFDLTRPLAPQASRLVEAEENDVKIRRWMRVAPSQTLGKVLLKKQCIIPGVPLFVIVSKRSVQYRSLFLDSCTRKDGPVIDLK